MEAARRFIGAVLEFSTGVEDGEDDFQRAFFRGRVLVDRDAAPVVLDGDRRSVGMQRHPNVRGVPVHGLVDGVVQDLPYQMMEAS
jgi:hypothetical protein